MNGCASEWSPMVSGVPQGSVLGPTLLIIFINDTDEGIANEILKFADDTKLFKEVSNSEEAFTIQENLHKLYRWSVDWQMLYNASKCKTIHIGFNNIKYDYFIEEELVSSASKENNIGVLINDSLSPGTQCAKAVKSRNKIMGIINQTYENKTKQNIVSLYKSLVRPHLEYCIQAWRQYRGGLAGRATGLWPERPP